MSKIKKLKQSYNEKKTCSIVSFSSLQRGQSLLILPIFHSFMRKKCSKTFSIYRIKAIIEGQNFMSRFSRQLSTLSESPNFVVLDFATTDVDFDDISKISVITKK